MPGRCGQDMLLVVPVFLVVLFVVRLLPVIFRLSILVAIRPGLCLRRLCMIRLWLRPVHIVPFLLRLLRLGLRLGLRTLRLRLRPVHVAPVLWLLRLLRLRLWPAHVMPVLRRLRRLRLCLRLGLRTFRLRLRPVHVVPFLWLLLLRLELRLWPVGVMPFLLHRAGWICRPELVALVFRRLRCLLRRSRTGRGRWLCRLLWLLQLLRLHRALRRLGLLWRLWLSRALWLLLLRLLELLRRLRARLRVGQGLRHVGVHCLRWRQCDGRAAWHEGGNRFGRRRFRCHGLDYRRHGRCQVRLCRHRCIDRTAGCCCTGRRHHGDIGHVGDIGDVIDCRVVGGDMHAAMNDRRCAGDHRRRCADWCGNDQAEMRAGRCRNEHTHRAVRARAGHDARSGYADVDVHAQGRGHKTDAGSGPEAVDENHIAVAVLIVGIAPGIAWAGWWCPAAMSPDPVAFPSPIAANPECAGEGGRRWRFHQHGRWCPRHFNRRRLVDGRVDIDADYRLRRRLVISVGIGLVRLIRLRGICRRRWSGIDRPRRRRLFDAGAQYGTGQRC